LEQKLQRITVEMNDATSDFQRLQQLVAEKDDMEKQYEDAIERWTYLNELYEKIEEAKTEKKS
jgi:ATP-binding cassette subfamily F protein uup